MAAADGLIAAHVARSFAVDPRSLDGVYITPAEIDAESWSAHAGGLQLEEWGS